MAAQANRLGVFLNTYVGQSGAQLRAQKKDSRDGLAARLGIATLSHFDFALSGTIDSIQVGASR